MSRAPEEPLTVWQALCSYWGPVVLELTLWALVVLLAIWFAGA